MRAPFNSLFKEEESKGENYLHPTQKINTGKIILNQQTQLTPGTVIDGVDFHDYKNHDFEIQYVGNLLFLIGIYKKLN